MENAMKMAVLVLGLTFGAVAHAASPRGQLKEMVAQLQKSPDDDGLRGKIIKLARTIKPAPALPDEAERRMARGTAAFEGAKAVTGYQTAAKEFGLATLAAPWYGDAYYNLGVAQDKAADYDAALRSLKLALMTSPDNKEIKALIYKVEFRKEEGAPAQVSTRQRDKDEALLGSLDGGVWLCSNDRFGRTVVEVHGRTAAYIDYTASGNVVKHFQVQLTGLTSVLPDGKVCVEGQKSGLVQPSWWCPGEFTISPDGSSVTRTVVKSPSDSYYVNGTETCQRAR